MIADAFIVLGLSGLGLGIGGIGSWLAAFITEMVSPTT